MYSFATLIALIPAIIFWHPISELFSSAHTHINLDSLILITGLGLTGISNQILRGKAYCKVNKVATLTPFLYTAVVFSGLLDWLVFQKLPDYESLIGAILIIASGLTLFMLKSNDTININTSEN